MIFASDNWAGASEKIIAALAEAARRGGPAYGGDDLTKAAEAKFSEIFEREVAVFPVATGTAANALGLSTYAHPGGIVFCHEEAHIIVDEAGASGFFGGGIRTIGLPGRAGKITPDALQRAIALYPRGNVHHGKPIAVSISQITELGAAFAPAEIAAIAKVAHDSGMIVHMDGARFAGAVAAADLDPADLTWKAGVDVMSFGGTKNGCFAAEAVVFFNPQDAKSFGMARQRAGHTFSKGWFVAAQFAAYLEGGHWLELARHANRMAARLVGAITSSREARLALTPSANEVFAIFTKPLAARLREAGVACYEWSEQSLSQAERPGSGEVLIRLVASFATTEGEVDRFAALLAE